MDYKNLSRQELIAIIKKQQTDFDALEAKFYEVQKERDAAIAKLEAQNEAKLIARARLFAPKSELRKTVFNEAEAFAKKTRKVGRPQHSENFKDAYLESRVSETITLSPTQSICQQCGESLRTIGEDITYKFEYIPAKFKVVKIISLKKACPKHDGLYQQLKNDPFPHSVLTPSFAATVLADKFLLGVPYYRQAQYYYNEGIKMSRQNLSNYQMRATALLEHYYDRLKYHLLHTKSNVLNADETSLKVVKEKKTCYMWVYLTSFYDYPIYIYEYTYDRSARNPIAFLNGFNGYLLTDAWNAYAKVPDITNCYCWVHARRNFMEIVKSLSPAQLPHSKAKIIVDLIDSLLYLEKEFREQNFSPTQIKARRADAAYLQILTNIKDTLINIDAAPESALGKAVLYMTKRWDGFVAYLEDGHIEMTNNIAERAIKPFVIARKNFLFNFTENGARSSAIYFSIQQTARANGFDPREFVTYLLTKINPQYKDDQLDYLMPWNITKEDIATVVSSN